MSFTISIMKNPADEWAEDNPVSNWNEPQGDHLLDLEFDGNDFKELHSFIGIKFPSANQLDGESFIDFHNRIKSRWLNAGKKKDYELLGRVWFWYESVSYFPNEIKQLLEECRRFRDNAQNATQATAAEKLIVACNEALKISSGIFLGSD